MTTRNGTGTLFVISSPSGGGKTTVVRKLLKTMPSLQRSVSVTTRSPRPFERQGIDYRFVSQTSFQQLRAQGQLLEWAKVHRAYYGTPKAPVQRALARGRDVILSIDVQGARQVRRHLGANAVLVFLVPPSLRDLKTRLVNRQTETPDTLRQRLRAARHELTCQRWYDYMVVNQELKQAVEHLKAIVIAERLRVRPTKRRNSRHD